jgi:beta-glucanase (GH16 family)
MNRSLRIVVLVIAFMAGLLRATDTPPPAPTNLAAQSGGNSEIPLTWNASPGATGYEVYRSTTQNDTNARRVAANVTGTSFRSTGLKNDATYYFRLKAVNAAGASGFSAEVAASTQITGQPLPDGRYTLAPKNAPALRLHAAADGRVAVRTPTRGPEQLWQLTSIDGAIYRVEPVAGVKIETIAKQAWKITAAPGGYRLVAQPASNLNLQAHGDTDGADASAQAANESTAAQIWNILPPADGDGAPDPGMAYVPRGYQLVFGDEFSGTALDTEKWEPLAPFSQPHLNEEMENYLPEAVMLENGFCVLTAEPHDSTCFLAGKQPAPHCNGKHAWRSGSITSRSTRTHGYYEARIKVPQGQGLWPAFWLTSSKRWPPEWDIVEIPFATGILYQYMHPTRRARLTWVGGAAGSDSTYTVSEGMPNPYDGFVIYGCEVTPEDIKMWVNGRLTVHWQVSTDMTDPMWVALNLAVGGKWPGPPDATTPRPARMFIDYLRVYQRPPDPHLAQPAGENPVPRAGP